MQSPTGIWLSELILGLLAKEPGDRPPSAQAPTAGQPSVICTRSPARQEQGVRIRTREIFQA